jgi:hypothetical protein
MLLAKLTEHAALVVLDSLGFAFDGVGMKSLV